MALLTDIRSNFSERGLRCSVGEILRELISTLLRAVFFTSRHNDLPKQERQALGMNEERTNRLVVLPARNYNGGSHERD